MYGKQKTVKVNFHQVFAQLLYSGGKYVCMTRPFCIYLQVECLHCKHTTMFWLWKW
jgi:hypothetical protein